MVVLATKMGFSSALGAFLMGSLLSGTAFTETTKKLLTPVKDLFSGIFFVSVGMMVDPALIIKYALPIAVLTAALIIGKTIFHHWASFWQAKTYRQRCAAASV